MARFRLLKDFRGLYKDACAAQPHCCAICNTSSPRTPDNMLDNTVALGLIPDRPWHKWT